MIKIILTALVVSVFTAAITIGILASNKKTEPTLTEYKAALHILSEDTPSELRNRSIRFISGDRYSMMVDHYGGKAQAEAYITEKAEKIINYTQKFEIWKKNNR